MNRQKFEAAKKYQTQSHKGQGSIGILKEGTLHGFLKYYIEDDLSCHEVRVGAFIADIKRADEIIEIQTRAFNKLRKKLDYFLDFYPVTLIYPITHIKWLSWINLETGEVSAKRKSPKKGSPYEAFFELYKIKDFLTHPNLSLCIMLIDMEEYKLLNGWSQDRKRGASRKDRVPLEIVKEIHIKAIEDYNQLIPNTLEPLFTSQDFKEHTKLSLKSAQIALNVLHKLNQIERIGKKGSAYIYRRIV